MSELNNRLDQLLSFVDADPQDTFSRYALAMEYISMDKNAEAVQHFDILVSNHPDYSATYYHYGKLMEKENHIDEARVLYEKGLKITSDKGEQHAHDELQEALDLLDI